MNMKSYHWDEAVNDVILDYETYIRLCECRSVKRDIIPLTKTLMFYNPKETKEDCLDYMLKWVLDWNNGTWDYTNKEYNKWLKVL